MGFAALSPRIGRPFGGNLMYYSMEWFGVDLGSIWDRFGDQFGVRIGLGSIWDRFGLSSGSTWKGAGLTK